MEIPLSDCWCLHWVPQFNELFLLFYNSYLIQLRYSWIYFSRQNVCNSISSCLPHPEWSFPDFLMGMMRAWAPWVWSCTEAWKASPNDPEKILFISNGHVKRSDAPHSSFGQAQTSSAQLPMPPLINRHLAMRRDCAIVERAALINSPADLWEHCAHTYIHTDVTVVPTASAHHVPGSQWAGTRRQTSFWRASTPGTVNSVHSESCKKLRPRAELHTARLTSSFCWEPHQELAGSLAHPCHVLYAGGLNWPSFFTLG